MDVVWPFADPATLVVAGDWHGNTRAAQNALDAASAIGAPVIIQLGDFGLWPGDEGAHYLSEVQSAAEQAGVHVVWIDGNHEDFPQLHSYRVSPDGLRHLSDWVHHIPRGSAWVWHGVSFLAMGGATSVDRAQRVPGKSWWPQEHVTDSDIEAAAAQGVRDVLLTHDCPSGIDIPGIPHRSYADAFKSGWPVGDLEHAWDHRDRVAEVIPSALPLHVWHGHFHVRYSAEAHLHDRGITQVEGFGDDGQGPGGNLGVAVLTPGRATLHNLVPYLHSLEASQQRE